MNPFLVQKFEQDARNRGYVPPSIPNALRGEDTSSYIMSNIEKFRFSPGIEDAKELVVDQFSIRNVKETSPLIPAFYANLNDSEVDKLRKSEYIVSVDPVNTDPKANTFSIFTDYYLYPDEVVPWEKQAINADDSITVSDNNFYIVDSKLTGTAYTTEINYTTNNAGYDYDHSTMVLALAVGKLNGVFNKGINPGQPVVHLGIQPLESDIADKIALISSMSEWASKFSVLNISMNTAINYSPNIYARNAQIGRAMRRASGRLLVVESAGNGNANACNYAFNATNSDADPYDGIMVVGGTDQYNKRYQQDTTPPGDIALEDRSNYGPCIDIWAPGYKMTTIRQDGTRQSITGTSFSAPLVAAVAARYGNSATRPIERETYIRDGSAYTGNTDEATGTEIRLAQYSPSSYGIPKPLPIYSAYSISSTTNLNKLYDTLFYDGIDWNAGGN